MSNPTHLAIDGVGAKFGGAATVLLGVVQAALNHPGLDRVTVFCSPRELRRFEFPYDPSLELIDRPTVDRSAAARLWWLEQGLARQVRRIGAGSLLCLGGGGIAPEGVVSATFIQRIQLITRQPLSKLGLSSTVRTRTLATTLSRSVDRSTWVFVQTGTVQQLVLDRLHVASNRVLVFEPTTPDMPRGPAHPAIDPMRAHPRGARLLYVGSASRHKDLQTLRKAMWLLRRSGVPAELFLTLPSDHPMALGEGLHGIGYLDDQVALRQAYEEADVVVLSSLEETVGLPLVEAMHFGRPVVAPDLPYAHDVCNDAALYFRPGDPRAAARTLRTLLDDADLQRSLGERGQAIEASRRALQPYHRMIDTLRHAERPPLASVPRERHAPRP